MALGVRTNFGETLNLGYLECTVSGKRSTPRKAAPVLNNVEVFGGTIKIGDTANIQGDDARPSMFDRLLTQDDDIEDELPVQRLDWTNQPIREIRRDGNMRYHVSKSANPNACRMDQKQHLVRTTRLEPRPSSRSSSRPSSRPSSRQRNRDMEKAEQIVVSEADLRRCGKSLTMLRQCHLPKVTQEPIEEVTVKNEMELSFKSAFRQKCQVQDYPITDPWEGFANPEELRAHGEGDLILNQVWVGSNKASPKKDENELEETMSPLVSARSQTSTRASSMDVVCDRLHKGEHARTTRTHGRSSSRSRRPHKARTEGYPCEEVTMREGTTPSLAFGGDESRSRRTRHASGLPKPASGRASSVTMKPKEEYVSRIREIGSEDGDESPQKCVGSLAVQEAMRMQRRFEQKINWEAQEQSKPQALWFHLDTLTGEVNLYSRAASTRLEAAYVNNRSNVPLAGLGKGLEDCIVHLAKKGGTEQPVQRSFQGGNEDVRRLQVRGDTEEVIVNVTYDHGWRIVDVPVPEQTEERRVGLNGTEMVRPPSPPLPPVNPDRRATYNAIRPWWGDCE